MYPFRAGNEMAFPLEPHFSKKTLILVALDVNFVLAVILICGTCIDGNPVSILQARPWFLLVPVSFPFFLHAGRFYNLKRNWLSPSLWVQTVLTVVAVLLVFFLIDRHLGGSGYLPWVFVTVGAALAAEVVVVRSVAAAREMKARTPRPVLVVGSDWAAGQVIDTIFREPRLRLNVVGMIDDDSKRRHYTYKGVEVLGGTADIRRAAERLKVKIIIATDTEGKSSELVSELLLLKAAGIEILDMPRFYERATGQVPIRHVGNSWFLYAGGFDLLHRPRLQKTKRCLDIAMSLTGILLSLPLMCLIALIVKLNSKGPIFFAQERMGQDEKTFRLIKFRTMREDAERSSGPVWASQNDMRITGTGRWLRKARLDEVPQFFNVLRGDMSFIGPRPERPFFVEKLKNKIPYYAFRFSVKPGLSGWAQINYHYGASSDDAVEKLKYELYYIKNMSPWLDMVIAIKTLKVVLLARGT